MAANPPTRLFTAPLGDVLRGRVDGILNYKQVLSEAKLPPELERYAVRVVGRTRLNWRERARAAEIVALSMRQHLRSAEPGGPVPAMPGERAWARQLTRQIVSERGSPGRLRAAIGRKLAWTLVAIALVYAIQFYRFRFHEPRVATNYAESFNATIRNAQASDRAWDILRRIGQVEPDKQDPLAMGWPLLTPTDRQWPIFAEFVAAHAAQAAMIREAASRPILGYYRSPEHCPEPAPCCFEPQSAPSPTDNPIKFTCLMPYLGRARAGLRLLQAEIQVAVSRADATAVVEDLAAILKLSVLVREPNDSMGELVSDSLASHAAESLALTLHEHPGLLTDAQLADLSSRFGALSFAPRAPLLVQSDLETALDIVQRSWTDDGSGDGHYCLQGLKIFKAFANEKVKPSDVFAAAATLHLMLSRKEIEQRLRTIAQLQLDYAKHPLWERGSSPGDQLAKENVNGKDRARGGAVCTFLGADGVAINALALADAQRDFTLTVIALERYRLAHNGTFPSSLALLVPDLLSSVPLDPFDGHPIRYKSTPQGPVLYSVGNNRRTTVARDPTTGTHP